MSSEDKENKSVESRRDFLRTTLIASAGLTAAAVAPKGVTAIAGENEAQQQTSNQSKKGYHVTRHIRDYYKSASF